MIQKGHKAVIGIYETQSHANLAVERLREALFRATDISVLVPTPDSNGKLGIEKSSKAPEGATAGISTGAILGAGLGWLAGIGALAIPGVGAFLAAGPIVGALAGVAVGGTVLGVAGALIGFGFSEYEAKRYEGLVREGSVLLSVHVDDHEWMKKAKRILQSTGGNHIGVVGEEKGFTSRPDSKQKFSRTDVPDERDFHKF